MKKKKSDSFIRFSWAKFKKNHAQSSRKEPFSIVTIRRKQKEEDIQRAEEIWRELLGEEIEEELDDDFDLDEPEPKPQPKKKRKEREASKKEKFKATEARESTPASSGDKEEESAKDEPALFSKDDIKPLPKAEKPPKRVKPLHEEFTEFLLPKFLAFRTWITPKRAALIGAGIVVAIGLPVLIFWRSTLPSMPPRGADLNALTSATKRALDAGATALALQIADRAVAEFPDKPPAYRAKAASLSELGKYDEARELYLKTIGMGGDTVDTRLGLANTEFASGRYREAAAVFRGVSRAVPGAAISHLKLFVSLCLNGDFEEAGRVVEWRPLPSQSPEWFVLEAIKARHEGKASDAQHFLDTSVKLHGKRAEDLQKWIFRTGFPTKDLMAAPESVKN